MAGIGENLAEVRRQIAAACARAGRDPRGVTLLAVSKTRPPADVLEALRCGQQDFGENYAQELRDKARAVAEAGEDQPVRWHFIGHLQRNKVPMVAGQVHLVHTVDSAALVHALARRCAAQGRKQDCLLEVNLGGEQQKAGCGAAELPELLAAFADSPALRCVGLMCIPPPAPEPEASRPAFRRLRELLRAHAGARPPSANVELRELSMGMSQDFPVAIEEGATIVRIGTAIFGPR